MARLGFDFVLIDLQHGGATFDGLLALLRAIEGSGAAPIVRVPSSDPVQIGRALDFGAWAVVVPMVESAEAAAAAVAATQHAPQGIRSYGPTRARAVAEQSGRCFVMVETITGLERVSEIAATKGLLGIFAGPSDLSMSMGLGMPYDLASGPHDSALAAIAKACAAAGIVAAVQTSGGPEARHRAEQGFRLISLRSDLSLMNAAATEILQDVTSHRPA